MSFADVKGDSACLIQIIFRKRVKLIPFYFNHPVSSI